MKSSEPVFTRKNPFPSEPHLPKSHYNPSRVKKIPKQQKKLALSPVRYNQRASPPDSPPCTTSLSPEDRRFLEGSRHEVLRVPTAVKGQQIFAESWPSTDRSSSPTSTDASQPQHTATSGTQEPSVLAKYVERFRYGRPQSRLERQRLAADGADDQQFWWMSSSPPQPSSSTPTLTSKECFRGDFDSRNADLLGKHQLNTSLSPTRGLLGLSVLTLSDTSHCETAEPEVLQLQERASRLLQKSERSLSSGSSSVPISSEGLGSDFSSPVSVDESMRRPIVVPSLMDAANLLSCPSMSRGGLTVASSALNSVGSRLRPEDDILFQWRLRRKMEQARQGSHMSIHNSALHQPLLNRLALQTQPGLSFTPAPIKVTGNHVSPPAFEPVLPVSTAAHSETCIQMKQDSITPSQIIPTTPSTREKGTLEPQNPGSLPQPHLRKHTNCSESLIELCRKQQCPSAQPPHPSERPDGDWYDRQDRGDMQGKGSIDVERKEKKARPASQKKNSDRYLRDDEIAERKIRHRNATSQKHVKAKETSKDNKGHGLDKGLTGGIQSGGAPPPSPVQNTLGRVVSEVLFPGDDSPVQSRTPCFTSSSINTSPEPSQSPAPLPQSHVSPPREVIGQLMQEAEDSDGLEFEDDPLLVVLRQQRKWVKEQLWEVDMMLDKLHED